ncbi:uncharacterized protein LOC126911126 isoform X1 [Spodoptera frugiperda]|uniref:Uncharacterized protein LOC118277162 isoform X4 n=1 Tax=Spodoptera frugiperda TaxID=7108 RepID=A0A9R0DRZ8_SPOFR|nr:uncharacterized protein LOC118277162 isoform X4 [Spodoptera frugiperda]XP_050552329.1 uncharacterized protein LOC126911126 isoform X1 [Spodoptera frugiperda]
MKTFIIIALLSALAACCSASVLPSKKEMAEGLTVVENADEAELQKLLSTHPERQAAERVFLFETDFSVPAIPGETVTHRIEYIGGPDTVLTGTHRTSLPPLPAEVTTEGWLTNRLVMTLTSEVGGSLVGNVKFLGYKYGR